MPREQVQRTCENDAALATLEAGQAFPGSHSLSKKS